ncbi:MAG: ribonuclease PH [Vampirovibrionales bacterium]|nr:ribonuclease PH [Vampirovibrionales bacterium]
MTTQSQPKQYARPDARQPDALRPVELIRKYTMHAPGAVLACLGHTKVLVTASVEERVPRHIHVQNQETGIARGWITAEYAMLPGATNTRNNRERNHPSGRSQEIQRLIGRSLRAAMDLKLLGARTITIDADVIQADGGTRVTAITGAYVALVDALSWLVAQGKLPALPVTTPVAAVSVGVLQGTPLLDLCYAEDSTADVDANVVMNAEGAFLELQATAESAPFSRAELDQMLALAKLGCTQLLAAQQAALNS